jgi:ankyrin repeat protein
MDMRLLEAATSGDTSSMKELAQQDQGVLLGTTQQGNTCLHIASAQGHEAFCVDVLAQNHSLVAAVNNDDETPLITAVICGHVSLALALLMFCRRQLLSDAVLLKDTKGCNALHYAIRSGHEELALELIATEPALSQAVNNNNESPLFISVVKNSVDVSEMLLQVPNFAHAGASRQNVLHAAVSKDNPGETCRVQMLFFR